MIDRDKLPERIPSPDWTKKPKMLSGIYEGQGLQNWQESRWTELRATYYAMCARVDHQFGLLVDALRDAELYDDTAIFFFSDHGDFTGDYGLVEKTQNTFEDCLTRVPFIIKPPASHKIQSGVRDALVELIDFPATVLDFTDITPDYDMFGRSLTSLIAGDTQVHREAVYCEGGRRLGEEQAMEKESNMLGNPAHLYYPRGMVQLAEDGSHTKATMCRTNKFKYVQRLYERDELYDLEQDPDELHNVIDDAQYAHILADLRRRMLIWYQETSDVVPHKADKRELPKSNLR